MVGKYNVLIGQSLKNLTILQNKLLLNGKPIMGAILLLILPPKKLFTPFLLYKKKDGTVVNTLCKTCAECFSTECSHSDSDRAFFGVYMISEIEFALQIGYQILSIYEVHYYLECDYLLQDFVKKVNYYKTKFSGCLKNCNHNEAEQYCNFLNSKMNLTDPSFQLTPANCQDNKSKRDFYKLLSNSLFGKFIQRDDQNSIVFAKSQEELNQYLSKTDKIEDISCLSDTMCLLCIKKDPHKILPNLRQNVYVGSQITAYAREVIFKHLLKLSSVPGCTLYHVDCDCIFFSIPKTSKCPLDFSHAVGDFKNEYEGEITNYYSFGPKQYCISSVNDGSINFTCKFSGLSLKSFINETKINDRIFQFYLDQFIRGLDEGMQLTNVCSKSNFANLTSVRAMLNFQFTNKMSRRRIISKTNPRLITFPYGY